MLKDPVTFNHIIQANATFAKQGGIDIPNNTTISYKPAIENKRVEATVSREIEASPGSIFRWPVWWRS